MIAVLDSKEDVGSDSNIAVDFQGNILIAYNDAKSVETGVIDRKTTVTGLEFSIPGN